MAAKKVNKSKLIRALLARGKSRAEIAKKLGVSHQLVYVVWRNANKKKKPKAKTNVSKSEHPMNAVQQRRAIMDAQFHWNKFVEATRRLEMFI